MANLDRAFKHVYVEQQIGYIALIINLVIFVLFYFLRINVLIFAISPIYIFSTILNLNSTLGAQEIRLNGEDDNVDNAKRLSELRLDSWILVGGNIILSAALIMNLSK